MTFFGPIRSARSPAEIFAIAWAKNNTDASCPTCTGVTARSFRSPKIRMRSVSSLLAMKADRSAKQFARGQCGGIFTVSI
jgi:hypothetical protein